jgi:rhodanese-related sulfurtransferase
MTSRMNQITAEELQQRLEAGEDLSVVDIRSEEDYEAETIEGSQNLPLREALLNGDLDAVQDYLDELPDDKEVVTFCDAGVASEQTAELLSDQRHDAKALDGGFDSWKEQHE